MNEAVYGEVMVLLVSLILGFWVYLILGFGV